MYRGTGEEVQPTELYIIDKRQQFAISHNIMEQVMSYIQISINHLLYMIAPRLYGHIKNSFMGLVTIILTTT